MLKIFCCRFGNKNKWLRGSKLSPGDYLGELYPRALEQVDFQCTSLRLVPGAMLLKMICIYYFFAALLELPGLATLGLLEYILASQHDSVAAIILALINMNHPHASIPNIFTFMWCLWKARNEALFCRKSSSPHQVQQAAQAIASAQDLQHIDQDTSPPAKAQSNTQIIQGTTISSDLIIAGTKIFSDASWKKRNIPGRGDHLATGIGVHIHIPEDGNDRRIMIQASTDVAHSPLIAEALALQFAAKVAMSLHIRQASFLTDNLSLAKMAASRNINDPSITWRSRTPISNFLQDTSTHMHAVYHISRNTNGITHNCARWVLNSRIEPVLNCTQSTHGNSSCPFLQSLLILLMS